jgi:hypothetical protein
MEMDTIEMDIETETDNNDSNNDDDAERSHLIHFLLLLVSSYVSLFLAATYPDNMFWNATFYIVALYSIYFVCCQSNEQKNQKNLLIYGVNYMVVLLLNFIIMIVLQK